MEVALGRNKPVGHLTCCKEFPLAMQTMERLSACMLKSLGLPTAARPGRFKQRRYQTQIISELFPLVTQQPEPWSAWAARSLEQPIAVRPGLVSRAESPAISGRLLSPI